MLQGLPHFIEWFARPMLGYVIDNPPILNQLAEEFAQMTDPRADVVALQYESWTYPEPIRNLETWLSNNWQWFDPSHAHRLLWPDRPYKPDMDILIAGCGTNQAAVFAYTNRGSNVVAIDISQPSLDHARYLKNKYALQNLELHLLPIEDARSLGEFDLIVSTGVLHHLADPQAGMKALSSCLRPDGVVALMLYARYGRHGVELLQSVFRDLGLHQDKQSLAIVKQALASLAGTHPLKSYLAIAPDLAFDAGLVDTFLHGRDRSYTTDGCRELLASAGLLFQDWFLKAPYYPPTLTESGNAFYQAVNELPPAEMFSTMERLRTQNACHFFLGCHAERAASSYRIDFAAQDAVDYIPLMRYRCGVDGQDVYRPGWRMRLAPAQMAFVQHIDGDRTVRQIAEKMARGAAHGRIEPVELETSCLALFEGLWRMDFLAVDLSATAR